MQNRRSWEGGSPSELEDVCRCKVAIRSFIEAGWSTYAEQIILPSNRAAAAASSLQTVYDLAEKRRVGLRFNCKNLTSKCGSLRFTCNRQPACRQRQRPRCSLRIIGMLWTGRSCRRRQCWLWRKRKRATGPASAPKLRQNRFNCNRQGLGRLLGADLLSSDLTRTQLG